MKKNVWHFIILKDLLNYSLQNNSVKISLLIILAYTEKKDLIDLIKWEY